MTLILVRFGELGLKSEKVRRRFLGQLADDVERNLLDAGIEHLMDVQRSRIFIDTNDEEGASRVLRRVPGIYSFSSVVKASSEKEDLMKALSEFGRPRLQEGMSYGLKVKRTGRTEYTSQEIAIEGGGAVMSHLEEGSVKVDLRDPDIWFEVEIRGSSSYLFTHRTRGLGGMPASSQGKVVLMLPGVAPDQKISSEVINRAMLSDLLMRRRGCRVFPVVEEGSHRVWIDVLEDHPEGETLGTISTFRDLKSELEGIMRSKDADGIIYTTGPGRIDKDRISFRRPVVELYPTISMSDDEVGGWLKLLFK